MMAFKDEGVEGNVKGVEFLLKKNKVDMLHRHGAHRGRRAGRGYGRGRLEPGPRDEEHRHRDGSDVATLPGVEIDEKAVVSSTGALELDKVPKHAPGHRRRRDRPGARLGLAPARLRGDGGRIPRPHPARHGRRGLRGSSSASSTSRACSSSSRPRSRGSRRAGRARPSTVEPAAGGER